MKIGKTYSRGKKVHWAKDTGRVMYWSPCGHELIGIRDGDYDDVTCSNCRKSMGLAPNKKRIAA